MQFSKKLGLLIAGLTCALAAHAGTVHLTSGSAMKPTGKGFGELDNAATQKSAGPSGGATLTPRLSLHTGSP